MKSVSLQENIFPLKIVTTEYTFIFTTGKTFVKVAIKMKSSLFWLPYKALFLEFTFAHSGETKHLNLRILVLTSGGHSQSPPRKRLLEAVPLGCVQSSWMNEVRQTFISRLSVTLSRRSASGYGIYENSFDWCLYIITNICSLFVPWFINHFCMYSCFNPHSNWWL